MLSLPMSYHAMRNYLEQSFVLAFGLLTEETSVLRLLVVQYRERIIFLGKAIDEETGNQLVATMLYLDSENKKDLNLYINCSGGDVRHIQCLILHRCNDNHHLSISWSCAFCLHILSTALACSMLSAQYFEIPSFCHGLYDYLWFAFLCRLFHAWHSMTPCVISSPTLLLWALVAAWGWVGFC